MPCELATHMQRISYADSLSLSISLQVRANDENRPANQAAAADKGGMFDGVAKIGRIAMRAFVNGSE